MSGIIKKKAYTRKPPRFLSPNLLHPHLDGCLCWFPFFEFAGSTFHDAITGARIGTTQVGTATWRLDQYHGGVYAGGGSGRYDVGDISSKILNLPTTGSWACLVEYRPDGVNSNACAVSWNGADDLLLYLNESGGPRLRWFWANVFFSKSYIHSDQSNENHIAIIGSRSAADHFVMLDGVEVGTYTNDASGARPFSDVSVLGWKGSPSQYFRGNIHQVRFYSRGFTEAEARSISKNPWAPFERRIWIPVEAGPPGPVQLNIDDTRHARAVDQVDVVELVTIVPIDIDSLSHGRRLDSLLLGVLFDLFLASLRHGRPIDAVAIDVSADLDIDVLRHARRVDDADVQALVGIVLDVSDQRHRRPVDSLLLDVDQPITIDGLRHGRPIDVAAVQPLLGDQTGIGATASNWILDAGQPLNNATSVDFDYHVLEGIFDSDQSVLGVDGARVTGSAGMRELTALTLGANVDGQERVQGEIAELRIYAGVLSQADRDRILQELIAKWITG